jgi:hypothetical protein
LTGSFEEILDGNAVDEDDTESYQLMLCIEELPNIVAGFKLTLDRKKLVDPPGRLVEAAYLTSLRRKVKVTLQGAATQKLWQKGHMAIAVC